MKRIKKKFVSFAAFINFGSKRPVKQNCCRQSGT